MRAQTFIGVRVQDACLLIGRKRGLQGLEGWFVQFGRDQPVLAAQVLGHDKRRARIAPRVKVRLYEIEIELEASRRIRPAQKAADAPFPFAGLCRFLRIESVKARPAMGVDEA